MKLNEQRDAPELATSSTKEPLDYEAMFMLTSRETQRNGFGAHVDLVERVSRLESELDSIKAALRGPC